MAAEDVINSVKAKLESLIAPIDGGAGADISYDEVFEKVRGEVEKMTSMSGGKVDWGSIASGSEELLTDKGKDFRVALYYAAARTQTDGVAGLLDGFVLLAELVAAFWTTMGPPLKRPKARGNLVSWFTDTTAPLIATYQPTAKDRDLVKALDQVSRGVDGDLSEKLGEAYGGMGALRSNISNLVRALPAEAPPPPPPKPPPPPPPPPPPRAEPEPSAAQEPAAAAQVVEAPAAASGGGFSAAAITDVDSANSALGPTIDVLIAIGGALRGADPSDPAAYRLLRTGLWLAVAKAPPSDNNTTPVPSPPAHYRDQLEGATSGQSWLPLVHGAENMATEAPLWLDPHRYAAHAPDQLGYADAKAAVLREIGALLARAPGLADLTFNDGTPFADAQTKDWIASEVKAASGSGGGGGGGGGAVNPLDAKINEARGLAASGALPDAVALMIKAAGAAATPADRFRAKLAVAQLCLTAEQHVIARAQLEGLDRLVEQHRLAEWAPDLCAQFYAALYQAHRGANMQMGMEVPPEQKARETLAFERLCQLDAGAALKLMMPG